MLDNTKTITSVQYNGDDFPMGGGGGLPEGITEITTGTFTANADGYYEFIPNLSKPIKFAIAIREPFPSEPPNEGNETFVSVFVPSVNFGSISQEVIANSCTCSYNKGPLTTPGSFMGLRSNKTFFELRIGTGNTITYRWYAFA